MRGSLYATTVRVVEVVPIDRRRLKERREGEVELASLRVRVELDDGADARKLDRAANAAVQRVQLEHRVRVVQPVRDESIVDAPHVDQRIVRLANDRASTGSRRAC